MGIGSVLVSSISIESSSFLTIYDKRKPARDQLLKLQKREKNLLYTPISKEFKKKFEKLTNQFRDFYNFDNHSKPYCSKILFIFIPPTSNLFTSVRHLSRPIQNWSLYLRPTILRKSRMSRNLHRK